VSVIVRAGVAVIGSVLLVVAFVIWVVIDVARGLRREREDDRKDDESVRIANGPAEEAAAMVAAWKPAPPVRRAPVNIPRRDEAFAGDGLHEELDRILREGDHG